jgi:hypothetical protein
MKHKPKNVLRKPCAVSLSDDEHDFLLRKAMEEGESFSSYVRKLMPRNWRKVLLEYRKGV